MLPESTKGGEASRRTSGARGEARARRGAEALSLNVVTPEGSEPPRLRRPRPLFRARAPAASQPVARNDACEDERQEKGNLLAVVCERSDEYCKQLDLDKVITNLYQHTILVFYSHVDSSER